MDSQRDRSTVWRSARRAYALGFLICGGAALLLIVLSLALGLNGWTARLIWYPIAVVAIAISLVLVLRDAARQRQENQDDEKSP